ncbi:MAG: hypothetical protein AVDCRST_MAG04-740, partial [uncultured Acetobacteraceae bacterium]
AEGGRVAGRPGPVRRAGRRGGGGQQEHRLPRARAVRRAGVGGGAGAQARGPRLRPQAGRARRGAPGRAGLLAAARGAQAVDHAVARGPRGHARARRGAVGRDGAAGAEKNETKPWL